MLSADYGFPRGLDSLGRIHYSDTRHPCLKWETDCLNRVVPALPWITAFLLVLSVYSFFVPPPGPNELSRYDLLLALARDHTVVTDRYCQNTMDNSIFNGHCYSNKSIGPSLLGVPLYWLADRAYGFGEYGDVRTDFPLWLVTLGLVSIPSSILVLLVYWVAREVSGSHLRAGFTALAFGFGTLAFPYATVFYGHQTGAFFAFGAFCIAMLAVRRGHASLRIALLAGFAAAWAVITEYPAVLVAASVGIYLISSRYAWSSRYIWRAWVGYGAGLAIGLVPLAIYNTVAFGKPWSLSYAHSFSEHNYGILGLTYPRPGVLWEITFSDLGLFARSPVLLLGIAGFIAWWRSGRERPEALLCGGISLLFLMYNSSYYTSMGGGYPWGPRFLVPALPFAVLGLAFLPRRLYYVAVPLAALSAVLMLMITSTVPRGQIGDPGVFLPIWWERFREGLVTPTWGSLRYGLQGLSSLLLLAIVASAGLMVYCLIRRYAGRSPAPGWASVVLASAVYGAVSLPPATVPSLFAPPSLEAPGGHEARLVFGDQVELLGYRLDRAVARPGDRLAVTLYWQARRPVDVDYTVFVHLVGKDGEVLGGWDTVPGGGALPTRMWVPGRVIAETYWVPVSRSINTPTLCRIEVGLYEFPAMQRLVAFSADGQRLGDSPAVARIGIPGPQPDLHSAQRTFHDFGGQVSLVGYRIENHGTSRISGKLYWQAGQKGRPERDYTVFVQALNAGRVVAQWDAQPMQGRYPTSLWSPGEMIEDWFELPLSPAQVTNPAQMEDVKLIAGLYDLTTMERLPVDGETFVELAGW